MIDSLLVDAAERARRYVSEIDARGVAPTDDAIDQLSRFDERLPAAPSDPALTLALLDEIGSPATVASTGGRYFGFVNGATLPVALATSWLVDAWDQNAALPVMSPVAAKLHEVCRDWLVDLFGLPPDTALGFVSGATMANAAALAAARDYQLGRVGWDVASRGLFGAPELHVVVGDRGHSTVFKALGFIGVGRERVIRVAADDQGRMRADQLPDITGPIVICAQAGEVNTGSFDPFTEIVEWARARDAWVHVDGAFGLWALADGSRSSLVRGLTDADSWATDGHKWLNVTYDCGMVFVRRAEDLRRTFAGTASYLPSGEGFEAMHHAPQSSQRARSVEVWAVLRSLGRRGISSLVQSACSYASRIGDDLRRGGLEVVNDVVLNQVLVRAADDELTSALIAAVQRDRTCWCGPSVWQGRVVMRLSVSSWRTSSDDAARSSEAILRCAREIGAI